MPIVERTLRVVLRSVELEMRVFIKVCPDGNDCLCQ